MFHIKLRKYDIPNLAKIKLRSPLRIHRDLKTYQQHEKQYEKT